MCSSIKSSQVIKIEQTRHALLAPRMRSFFPVSMNSSSKRLELWTIASARAVMSLPCWCACAYASIQVWGRSIVHSSLLSDFNGAQCVFVYLSKAPMLRFHCRIFSSFSRFETTLWVSIRSGFVSVEIFKTERRVPFTQWTRMLCHRWLTFYASNFNVLSLTLIDKMNWDVCAQRMKRSPIVYIKQSTILKLNYFMSVKSSKSSTMIDILSKEKKWKNRINSSREWSFDW